MPELQSVLAHALSLVLLVRKVQFPGLPGPVYLESVNVQSPAYTGGIKELGQAFVAFTVVWEVTCALRSYAAVTPPKKLWLNVDTQVFAQPLLTSVKKGFLLILTANQHPEGDVRFSSVRGGILLLNSIYFS